MTVGHISCVKRTSQDDSSLTLLPSQTRLAELILKYRLNLYYMTDVEKNKMFAMFNNLQLDRKIPIKLKQIEHIVPKNDECIICATDYKLNENISQCFQCKQQLHSSCLSNWYAESVRVDTSIRCPFCRAEWQHGTTIKCAIVPAV